MKLPKYYEDVHTLHVGTLPPRAYFVPFSDAARAAGKRETSDRFLSLCGQWRFGYYDSLLDVPQDVFAPSSAPDTLEVPSVWQMHGYDSHQYVNVQFPFPYDPPYVPTQNPCGLYQREFTLKKRPGEVQHLCFEGVDSCYYVWVNGQLVGYSQVSHAMAEFDITSVAKSGLNCLTVLVLKWCDGSYFEDQDKLRMSGIFRDVYILRRPENHLRNYRVTTELNEGGQSARVRVSTEFVGDAQPVAYKLIAPSGAAVADGWAMDGRIDIAVDEPALWNAEAPALYTLFMTAGGETVAERVGIRQITIEDGVVLLNGSPIKFRGVNRHDSDPVLGPAVGEPEMLRDLTLMKLHNINAIRTSHYPNSPLFPRLCDELGFYLITEADAECHGVNRFECPGDTVDPYDRFADDPEWGDTVMDRVQLAVSRDVNRPSVLIWSMGNEAGMGVNFDAALDWTKAYDPTRLTHYERASYPPKGRTERENQPDLHSRMYASVADIDEYFEKGEMKKPFVQCEYIHAMGNGPGDIEDYFNCIQRHEGMCGGFVWEWCDHAVYMGKTLDGRKKFYYGGDFGEKAHDGNFCVDGLVSPDRTPHMGLIELKNVQRPLRFTALSLAEGRVNAHNYMDFTNASVLQVRYEVRKGGRVLARGGLTLDIAPHGDKEVTLELPGDIQAPFALYFETLTRTATALVPAGHQVGVEQLGDPGVIRKAPVLSGCPEIREDERYIELYGRSFRYLYNKTTAAFERMVYGQRTLLKAPMAINIWRAPTDNERRLMDEMQKWGYDRAEVRTYGTQTETTEEGIRLTTDFSLASISMPRILTGQAVYIIDKTGAVSVSLTADMTKARPPVMRFGLYMALPEDMKRVRYEGYGPYESYVDKRRASVLGEYETTVDAMYEDYIKPQEGGSRYGCRSLRLSGGGLTLSAFGDGFCFNASRYSLAELQRARHDFELEKGDAVYLALDGRQSGIGSASCGPMLDPQYAMPEHLTCALVLKPGEEK